MVRRGKNWFSEAKGLIRMSWSKHNLYNLATKRPTNTNDRTLYQQMFQAKKETRGYHDSEISEKQWKKVFKYSTQIPTSNTHITEVLDPGASPLTRNSRRKMMHPRASILTFAELERRIDFIVFRSHFASSILHAKQLVLHGKVTVNGEKVRVSSTRVNDGDIIQVNPTAVCTLSGTPGTDLDFKPHPYSEPSLFLPPYLEVDYSTCSVVFLRSPTSRPNKSEIPSPYGPQVHSLAFEFYAGKH